MSIEAQADMEAMGDYIACDNPGRAENLVEELRARCIDLQFMPPEFPLVPRYGHRGVRRRGHGNYLNFYRVEEDRVVVLHVLHGATDYAALLFPPLTLPD